MNSTFIPTSVKNVVPLMNNHRHCRINKGAARNCTKYPDHVQLDRIDLQVEVVPVPLSELNQMPNGESSAQIRERVIKARAIQEERFKDIKGVYCNAQMSAKQIQQFAKLDYEGENMLANAMNRLGLSARAYERILKMARTIADIEGSVNICGPHIREAISYRNLDRSTWGE